MKPHEATKEAKRRKRDGGKTEGGFVGDDWADYMDWRLLDYCHPWQRQLVEDTHRWITAIVGRGGGKTTGILVRLLRKMARIKGGRLVYCASSRPMAEELMWLPLKDQCERLSLVTGEDVEFNETKLRCTFLHTGATLRLFGIDNVKEIDKLRGQPFDEVALDEASIYPPELLDNLVDRVIEPRLGDRLGTLVMIGTPSHIFRGKFYETTRPGSSMHRPYADRALPEHEGFDGWSSHIWTNADVATLPEAKEKYTALFNGWHDALRKKAKNEWSDDHPIWQREYLGRWAADDTETVYKYLPSRNEWDPLNHQGGGWSMSLLHLKKVIAALPKLGDWHYVVATDEGSKDPFAVNIFAFSPNDPDRGVYHVYCFEQRGFYARPLAELLSGKVSIQRQLTGGAAEPYDGLFSVVGYPDAAVMDGPQSTIDEVQNVYGIRFVKEKRERDYKFGAIELVNGDLIDGRLKILKGSPLAIQLGELQWQVDQYGNMQENKSQANHSTDCLIGARKAIAQMFDSGMVEQTTKQGTKVERTHEDVREKEREMWREEAAERENAEIERMMGSVDENFDDMFGGPYG